MKILSFNINLHLLAYYLESAALAAAIFFLADLPVAGIFLSGAYLIGQATGKYLDPDRFSTSQQIVSLALFLGALGAFWAASKVLG